jgi:hypothetical protein
LKNEITDLSKKGILTSRIVRNSFLFNPESKKFSMKNHNTLNTQLNASRINTSVLVDFSHNLNSIWSKIFSKGKTPEKILDALSNEDAVSNWLKK